MLNRWNFLKTGFYEGIKLVLEITELNQRIDAAKSNPHKAERRQLEQKRSLARDGLKAIDAELERRGLDSTFESG